MTRDSIVLTPRWQNGVDAAAPVVLTLVYARKR